MPAITRRDAVLAIGGAVLTIPLIGRASFAQAADDVSKEMILNDPAAPTAGNPKGDVTIVAFLDYNCPFCKKSAPDLDRIVKEDGKIRLVYKDWPVIRPTSIDGAMMALAAKYQGKYDVAHHALMGIPGVGVPKDKMRQGLQAAGLDMARLDADMKNRSTEIQTIIQRNMAQADAIGFSGTPAYLVGPFQTSTLDYQGFKQVVSDARKKQAEGK
ncbi:MAG: DsbA family protein [Bradyrhizobium sp.]|jgi:protein-disulfide isomerase|uniref:DsbA family protein n=1 Tax=Hyphomicrobiales TaxID=356 RepID=UPI0007DA5731|nr:DsbA family protein [Shinella sp. HZN7]ANH05740.1 disulfide bond formation protein DsbA [Shinella sp. HZN7]